MSSNEASTKASKTPKVPNPRACLMGLPLEIRLRIYDYVLLNGLTKMYHRLKGPTQLRNLFCTTLQIRKEVFRYSLLRRRLIFEVGGPGGSFFDLGMAVNWLERVNPEDKGRCQRIHITMQYDTFRYLRHGVLVLFDTTQLAQPVGEVWSKFCKLLPPSPDFEIQVTFDKLEDIEHFGEMRMRFLDLGGLRENPWALNVVEHIKDLQCFDLYFVSCASEDYSTARLNREVNELLHQSNRKATTRKDDSPSNSLC